MDKEQITWRTFSDPRGAIVGTWNPSTPSFYLIDPDGKIRYKWVGNPGEKALDTALEELIHEAEGNAKKQKGGR
jgi:peroxiredoxin